MSTILAYIVESGHP